MDRTIDPHLFVIFGGTGDLTRRKLAPSFYRILAQCGAAATSTILGIGSSDLDDAAYRRFIQDALHESGLTPDEVDAWCDERVFFHRLARDADGYEDLAERISAIEEAMDLPGNRAFYLALPPQAFPATIDRLGTAGLHRSPGWTRLVVEKPFGHDLASAHELNELVHRYFDEGSVYRIDHYLGKETVQNLLTFRFANPLFEGAWNRDRVESVEITVAEKLGIGSRAGYYDAAGALRDMVQNHLTQLLTLVAMEPPAAFEADAIRNEKVKVLRSLAPIGPSDVTLAQYGSGTVDGTEVPAYRDEDDVPDDSRTPTYAGLVLRADTWRWQGVPFYLRTGKRLPRRLTEIRVTFRRPPVCLFHGIDDDCEAHGNVLIIRLQPDEGFTLLFDVKSPDESVLLERHPFRFRYSEAFGDLPDGYETLLLDVLQGDQTLFVRADEVEESWRAFAPVLDLDVEPEVYAAGTWGPPAPDGHTYPGDS